MTKNQLFAPISHVYEDFAVIKTTVVHEELLEGNAGQSSVRINVEGAVIWLDDEYYAPSSVQDFTIRLRGTSEHKFLAKALRDIANELDKAPHAPSPG